MKKSTLRAVLGALAAAASVAAPPTQAAVVYSGSWDPVFGSPFGQPGQGPGNYLTWSATAKFVISTPCSASLAGFSGTLGSGGSAFSSQAGCAFQAGITDIGIYLDEVSLTLSIVSQAGVTVKSQTLPIGSPYTTAGLGTGCEGEDQRVTQAVFSDGLLTSFSSSFSCSGLVFGDLTGENPDIAAQDFFLKLGISLDADRNPILPDASRAAVRVSTANANSSLNVSDFSPTSVSFCIDQGNGCTRVTAPSGSQVPEPGALLLALTALGIAVRFGRRG